MSLFGLPKELGFASMNNIYMEDKNRYKTIKWLKEFIESYSSNPHQKVFICTAILDVVKLI